MPPDQEATLDGSLRTANIYVRVGAMAEAVKLYQELGFPALQKGGNEPTRP
jgi:hypothetical protein